MKIFRTINADTPGEEFARHSIERAGFLFTAAPTLAILVTLVAGFHAPVLIVLAYVLALTAAEGIAGIVYLVIRNRERAGYRRRASLSAAA